MKRALALLGAPVLSLFLFAESQARADLLDPSWHYQVVATPSVIVLNAGLDTKLELSSESPNNMLARQGSSNYVATNIITSAGSMLPTVFAGVPYNLEVTIRDDESSQMQVFDFTGSLSGSLSKAGSLMTNHFDDLATHDFKLGQNSYSIVLNSFVAPSGPGALNLGSIGGTITVRGHDVPPQTQDAPEPSTLLLLTLGLSGCGLFGLRKKRINSAQ